MGNPNQWPSKVAAYEAGLRAGREERARAEREADAGDGGPESLTLEAIRAGRYSNDELAARKDEVDALLAGGQAA
jgi:hypothetical protein